MKGFPVEAWTYLACCMFFLGMYKEAEEACAKGMCCKATMTKEFVGSKSYFSVKLQNANV